MNRVNYKSVSINNAKIIVTDVPEYYEIYYQQSQSFPNEVVLKPHSPDLDEKPRAILKYKHLLDEPNYNFNHLTINIKPFETKEISFNVFKRSLSSSNASELSPFCYPFSWFFS